MSTSGAPPPASIPSHLQARRGRRSFWILLAVPVLVLGWVVWARSSFPSDRTPEGAYLRVMIAVNRGRPEDFFAYIETAAQHACYSIRDYKKASRARVLTSYPEPERTRLEREYAAEAATADAPALFALYARRLGWINRLRRDLSGIAKVEINGERATVQTARGTRYPWRRRAENGIWGLTLFTAQLSAEAEKAARDAALIEQAAADYARAAAAEHR